LAGTERRVLVVEEHVERGAHLAGEIGGTEEGVDDREAEALGPLRPHERLGHEDDLAWTLPLELDERAEQLVAFAPAAHHAGAGARGHAGRDLHEENRREAVLDRGAEVVGGRRGPAAEPSERAGPREGPLDP